MLPELSSIDLREKLRKAIVIRRFEEGLIKLARDHEIGHFHVYVGQEITGVFALGLLEEGDLAFSTHRNHGHLLAKGADTGRMVAEILGKETGYNGGRGGTLHIAASELGFPTTSAATGGCTPLATGAAYALQRLGSDRVSVCLFGDGALEEGSYHESINIAALEALPVIFLCENNSLHALGQQANEYPSSTMAAVELTDLAKPFGVPTKVVDGSDAAAVHDAMMYAVVRARRGEGPTFLETRTVRWPGNRLLWPELVTGETDMAMAWDSSMISGEHSDWHLSYDGLLLLVRDLLDAGHLTQRVVQEIDNAVQMEVDEAIRFGLDSQYPDAETALDTVFA